MWNDLGESVSMDRGLLALLVASVGVAAADEPKKEKAGAGSAAARSATTSKFARCFRRSCQGCHQPAKAGGGYVMTAFDRLIKGGESDDRGDCAGQARRKAIWSSRSRPTKTARPRCRKSKPALSAGEIELITRWIAEGANDDTPRNAQARYDMDHPPEYTRLPVIPRWRFRRMGRCWRWRASTRSCSGRPMARSSSAGWWGLSERVESLAFSPDGKKLAVTGGLPSRMGEVQVWDVAKRKLALSVPVTYDTVYGVSWSPDGTKIAFGCADNTVRAIDAKTGEQVLVFGIAQRLGPRHGVFGRWLALDVGRPRHGGQADRGGDSAIRRQHHVDHAGCAQGGPERGRTTSQARRDRDRRLGRRAQALPGVSPDGPRDRRRLEPDPRVPPLPGRVYSVAVSADGKRIAAGSSLDGKGEVSVYGYEFDTSLPAEHQGDQ